jgi:hypothetical protein
VLPIYTRTRVSVSSIAAQGWSRWTAALAALVLVVTAVAAGARYVVCARTGTTHSHACCAQRHAKASRRPIEPARFVPVRSCCEPRVVPASGASAIEHSPPAIEPGGAVLAQLAWAAGSWLAADSTPQAEHWPIRAGPLGPAERRAWLQVFLI